MRKFMIAGATIALLSACQSPEEQVAEKKGEMIEDVADGQANAIEAAAEGEADALEDAADAVRKADPGANSVQTKAKANDLEDAADVVRRDAHSAATDVREAGKEAADQIAE